MASADVARTTPNLTHQQFIEATWADALIQLQSGSLQIVISATARNFLGQQGIVAIADRFSAMIGTRASVLHDPSVDVIRILPPPKLQFQESIADSANHSTPQQHHNDGGSESALSTNSTSSSPALSAEPLQSRVTVNHKAKIAKDRLTKVPRPPNAFILYRQDHHPTVKSQNPNIHNNEISVIIGNMWKNETQEIKNMYKERSETVKRQHIAKHPEYQYQPRKASEKKRRMSKKKAATLRPSKVSIDSPDASSVSTSDSSPLAAEIDSSRSNSQCEAAIDPLLFTPFVMPDVIPDFDVLGHGAYMTHEFDPLQPGLFGKMVEKHNQGLLLRPHHPGNRITPQAIPSGAGKSTVSHHHRQQSLIGLGRREAEFANIRKQYNAELEMVTSATAFNVTNPYASQQAYDQYWLGTCDDHTDRFLRLDDEFSAELCFSSDNMLLDTLASFQTENPTIDSGLGSGTGLDTFMGSEALPVAEHDQAHETVFDQDFFHF